MNAAKKIDRMIKPYEADRDELVAMLLYKAQLRSDVSLEELERMVKCAFTCGVASAERRLTDSQESRRN